MMVKLQHMAFNKLKQANSNKQTQPNKLKQTNSNKQTQTMKRMNTAHIHPRGAESVDILLKLSEAS